ncbi:MAG: cystathionine beta-lyase [Proteobacteria bacterium]|nr:cystathionine beta-lyase [Pseudomonadota bacterium]
MGRPRRHPGRHGPRVSKADLSKLHVETRFVHAGRNAPGNGVIVNPPLQRATTLLFEDAETLYDAPKTYAIDGMAVQEALRDMLVAVEGGAGAVLAPSGLAACTLAILTVARADSELLVVDSAYKPTRNFCTRTLRRFGVRPRFYDPRIGAGIAELIGEQTCAVFLESPGSLTFEVQDVPAIAAAGHARGVPVLIDNTWSAGVYFKPFEHGADLSIQAISKYQGGHADVFLGSVGCATTEWQQRVWETHKQLGMSVSPDDAFLALRGMRTLGVRLERQGASALRIAQWLAARPQVVEVLHPALSGAPDHALWKRDFTGASGLFGVVIKAPPERLKAMLESLRLFAMGWSWGGYESLITPSDRQIVRTVRKWSAEGATLRLYIGLEHPDDLIADLEQGFARLA